MSKNDQIADIGKHLSFGTSGHVTTGGSGPLTGLSTRNKAPYPPQEHPQEAYCPPNNYDVHVGNELVANEMALPQNIDRQVSMYGFQQPQPFNRNTLMEKRELDITHPEVRKRSDIYISVQYSLNELARNPDLLTIPIDRKLLETKPGSKGIILSVELKQIDNQFPIALGWTLKGVKNAGRVVSALNNNKYSYITLSGLKKDFKNPRTVYAPSKDLNVDFLRKFGHINMEMVENSIHPMNASKNDSFVEIGSPIIDVLRARPDLIGSNIDEAPSAFGQFKCIDNELIDDCKKVIQEQYIDKMHFTEMDNIAIQIGRPDGAPFDSIENIAGLGDTNPRIAQNVLNRKNTVTAVFSITHAIQK